MEKAAIEQIQKTANMVEMNQELSQAGTHYPTMLVPEGFQVKNLESFMQLRSSYRFSFKTKSINDFVEYSKEFDQEGAKCFVNSDNMSAKVIFDLGTETAPLHQDNRAGLNLDKTSAYRNLLSIDGNHLSQKAASNFIEDWADHITVFTKAGDHMTIAQAANALNNITIESARSLTSEVDDFGESMSAMEKIEAKNKDKIPADINFKCVPYLGLNERTFKVRVSILTGGSRPEISLRIIQLEPQQEEIAEEFKDILVKKFKSCKLQTFIGEC